MWFPALSKILPLMMCWLLYTPPAAAWGMKSAVIASVKQVWADLRTEVTDVVQVQTPNLALASTFGTKDPETATSPATAPAETLGRRFPILLVGGVFSVLAIVGLVRQIVFTARRMALPVAATWQAYLQRMVSGIVASGLRRPFARLQAELTSALPRLWGAVSNLNLRLGRVEELHRCAMNARGAMCRKARRLDETVEWLTETVLNLEAIVSETRPLVATVEWLTTSIVNLQAIIGGGAAQLNHVTTLVNGLLTAAAQARRELDDARQEVVDVTLQRAADQITSMAAIDRIAEEHARAVARIWAESEARDAALRDECEIRIAAACARMAAEIRADFNARLLANAEWR